MSQYLDQPTRTREEYLIEKMKALTMTKADWQEWLNMPRKTSQFRSIDIPERPPTSHKFFFFPSSFPERS